MNETSIHSEGGRRGPACDAIAHPDGEHAPLTRAAHYFDQIYVPSCIHREYVIGHGRQTTT
jgi:hypothetical protein